MEVRADAEPVGSAPERLLHRVARGDHSAFTELVAAHDSDIVRLCFLISSDAELARDATQNAWQRLWSKPPRLRDETKLRSWLLSVAANEARQMIRRRGIGRVREIQAESRSSSLDNERSDDRLDLQAVLRRLEPADRELLGLRFLFEMSSDQIGAHLGISGEGARTRLHRLLVRIRRELGID